MEYEPEVFEIGGNVFTITTIACLPIAQLMNNHSKDVEISGQKLWCGSLGIIQYLLNNKELVNNSVVVELGAGTGVLGMVCKKLGASKVILTDHDEKSLQHMQMDLVTNDITAEVVPVNWYNVLDLDLGLNTNDELPLRVVAGDVLYKAALLDPFFKTVKTLFSQRQDSLLLLCHVPRAGVDQADVVRKAQSEGLSVQEIPAETWNSGEVFQYCPEEDLVRARVYCIKGNTHV